MLESVPLPPERAARPTYTSAVRLWLQRVAEAEPGTYRYVEPILKTSATHAARIAPRGVTTTTRRIDHLGVQAPRGYTWLYAIKEGTS